MKIKSFSCYILFVTCMLSLGGCKNDDQTRLQADWTSKDPIAIPFNARNNEWKLGNLVVNQSFETGKIYYEESNIKSYDIDGWKKVGQNIQWVNSNSSEWSNEDVYDGKHAIKIERKHADETETTGDGIISDFIKVIPGNYSLKLHLKLKDICPNQSRIGTKMYDAINIRLQYFDKNRLPIDYQEYNAFTNKKIDNSFKTLTLANYWSIDEMKWGEIHGKTAYHPFYDGDIPDEARYVKVFIGLKGTGQMWIDDVDFRYTDQNFTMLERIKPYFDSSYLAYEKVYPAPQVIHRKKEIKYFNQTPVIVIPKKAEKEIKEVAALLKAFIEKQIQAHGDSINSNIQVVSKIDTSKVFNDQLVISIGKTELHEMYKRLLPDSVITKHKDSYYINQPDLNNIIFINTSSSIAFDYALNTVKQLFINSTYYSTNIIDYPDFLERAYLLHSFDSSLALLNKKMALLSRYKFNSTYFEWYTDYSSHYPFSSLEQVDVIDKSIMINLNNINSSESSDERRVLLNKESEILNSSFKSVLLADDYYHDIDNCNSDQNGFSLNKSFNNTLQQKHIELLKQFAKNISKHGLKTQLEFLSPWNRLEIIDRGHGKGELYYYDLHKEFKSNLTMYWTGGTYYSCSIDHAEFFRMSDIMSEVPVFFDNSLLADDFRFNSDYERNYYAGKIRVKSLIEPYNLNAFNDFYEHTEHRKVLLNTTSLSELNTIRVLTAADYFWNSSSYNPDKSLWIVLNKLLGRENAIHLIYFNDAYYGLKEICQKIEMNGQQFKNTRIAKNFESQLTKYYDLLNKNLQNRELAEELAILKADILLRYNELTINVN